MLGPGNVPVIDEAGMVGSRRMERIIGEAEKRGAKVVLVGDPEQSQGMTMRQSYTNHPKWADSPPLGTSRDSADDEFAPCVK